MCKAVGVFKSFVRFSKKVRFFSQEILESQGLISFKQFLLRESEQSVVDDELRNIRNDIRVTKSRILLKHLIRKHKILKDVERSTSTKTGFIL